MITFAGGRGQRLWPASRNNYPKQFIDFFGTGKTMLQTTYERFAKILPKENIYICSCKGYLERDPQANIVVTPSDQLVLNLDSFYHSVNVGIGYVAENDVLLAMGVKPTRPEPGYGYIQLGDQSCKPEVFKVKSFTEKPERDFATMFMESGEFYWNTGIFIANARHLIASFEKIFPLVLRNLKYEMPNYTLAEELEYVEKNYPRYPNLSLDYAILEQSEGVFVMKCDFGWADMGTWHAIYEAMQKVDDENVVLDSQVELEDCKNNIIKLPKGRLGVISGLDGYIVVEKDSSRILAAISLNSSSESFSFSRRKSTSCSDCIGMRWIWAWGTSRPSTTWATFLQGKALPMALATRFANT